MCMYLCWALSTRSVELNAMEMKVSQYRLAETTDLKKRAKCFSITCLFL